MARSSPKFRRRELSGVHQMAGLPGLAGSSPKFRRRELSRVHQMAKYGWIKKPQSAKALCVPV